MRGYDHAAAGSWFVTITLAERRPLLSRRYGDTVGLLPLGCAIEEVWRPIPQHFPSVSLDEWILMPDHLHGILLFWGDRESRDSGMPMAPEWFESMTPEAFAAPTRGSLPTVLRSFKSAATHEARRRGLWPTDRPLWQRGYYEHLIRSPESFEKVREYIRYNPLYP